MDRQTFPQERTPLSGKQQLPVDEIWHLRKPNDGRVGINAQEAWNALESWKLQKGDPEVRVVLCDYGVEHDHPALKDGIDLERARDFDHTLDPQGLIPKKGRIADAVNAHGTACAGLVCGIRVGPAVPKYNDLRFIGVAPASKLVPFRISTNFELKSLIRALKDAADERAGGDVILLPRFLPRGDKLEEALKDVASRVPVICAAGNDGRPPLGYPASLPEVIAVGACNDRGYRSTYSNYGANARGRCPDGVAPSNDVAVDDRTLTRLDVDEVSLRWREERREAAKRRKKRVDHSEEPTQEDLNALAKKRGWNLDKFGEWSIATTDNLGESGYNADPPGNYCKVMGNFGFGGTSAASSLVAGVVALMLTANGDLKRKPTEIRDLLHKAASHDSLWLQRGTKSVGAGTMPKQARCEFGYGLIDARKAVQLARMWKIDQWNPKDQTSGLPPDWVVQLSAELESQRAA